MSKKGKYTSTVLDLFKPSESGYSQWVPIELISSSGLPWGNNGNTRRKKPTRWGPVFEDYLWEFQRVGDESSKVLAIRMAGIDLENEKINSTIRKDIKDHFSTEQYCNISDFPATKLEIDHRWGYKDHPKYAHVNKIKEQTVEDFQAILRQVNLQKRQICKSCIEIKKRPKHPRKEYVIGNEILDDVNVCNGCYLAQPELYR